MAEALTAAGPWAAFLLLCLAIVIAYSRDKVISGAAHKRTLAEIREANEREVATERRIAGFQEQRADLATARAEKADAALATLVDQLPPALTALAATKAGAA